MHLASGAFAQAIDAAAAPDLDIREQRKAISHAWTLDRDPSADYDHLRLRLLLLSARCRHSENDFVGMTEDLERAAPLLPKFPDAVEEHGDHLYYRAQVHVSEGRFEEAREHFRRVETYYLRLPESPVRNKKLRWTVSGIGDTYFHEGNPAAALEAIYYLRQRYSKGAKENAYDEFSISAVHIHLADYALALDHGLKALAGFREAENPNAECQTLGNIAVILHELGDHDGAIQQGGEAIRIAREIGNPRTIFGQLINQVEFLLDAGRVDEAESLWPELLAQFSGEISPEFRAHLFEKEARIAMERGQWDRSFELYQECLTLLRPMGITRQESETHFALARLAYRGREDRPKRWDAAIAFLNDGIALAEKHGEVDALLKSLEMRAKWYETHDRLGEALRDFRDFHERKMRLLDSETVRRTRTFEVTARLAREKYAAEQLQAQVSEMTETKELLENLLQKRDEELAEASRIEKFRREMLGMAAHDLKNPLGQILTLSNLIRESDQLEETRELAGFLENSSEQMLRLIHDLLENAALETNQIQLRREPHDLGDLLVSLVDRGRTHARQKEQTVRFENNLPQSRENLALVDLERFIQIFDNLYSNAIKYSPLGGTIAIVIDLAASTDGSSSEFRISVRDEGPGFTEQEKRRLFRPFGRLGRRPTGGESSTGLGLSIARRLVELHGGRILADSPGLGQGAIFTVTLPAQSREAVPTSTRK